FYVALTPKQSVTHLPRVAATHFYDAIFDGAAGRLLGQPAKPYTNPALATYHMQRFNAAIGKFAGAAKGGFAGAPSWNFPRFGKCAVGSSIFPAARAQLEAGTFAWTAGTIRAVMLPPGVVIDYSEEYLQDIPAGSRIAISADIEGRAVNGGWFAGNPVSFGVVFDTRLVSQVVLFLDTGNEATSLLIAHLGDEGIIGDPFAPMGVEYF